jgi:type I restriction enzyme R subunit
MMNNETFTENNYEQTLAALFQEKLSYEFEYGPNIKRNPIEPYIREDLEESLKWLNGNLPDEALKEAFRIVTNITDGTLEKRNETFMDYLQNGIEVKYYWDGGERTDIVNLVDYRIKELNKFKVVNQWTVSEYEKIRCDMVVFLNGLPLVVIELKSPSSDSANIEDAYRQIKHYQQKCPSLFVFNAFSVISDMTTTKAGTITANENRYMEWKTVYGDYESTTVADYNTFFQGIFLKSHFLDILNNFICFDHKDGKVAKIMAAYHQFFAVNMSIYKTDGAINGSRKIGVFWHTQGSGKSLSMVFYAHKLIKNYPKCSILVVTDRNDLDQQLYEQFVGCKLFLRQEAQRVGYILGEDNKIKETPGREDLRKKLKGLQAGGVIFTTIQKFENGNGVLSDREDIIVITDEAHRSQYGEIEYDADTGKEKKGFSKLMREALPNASFIGFTGTPVSDRDRDTKEVFGDYIDIYDMTQAVADGATKPVYYESRVINLNLDEHQLELLDAEFDKLAIEGATEEQREKVKKDNSGIRGILRSESTIRSLCNDIIAHYEENRQNELTGKAMIVALDKESAVKIYCQIMILRPQWKNKVHVVVSSSNSDEPGWSDVIRPKKEDGKHYWTSKEFASLFKDDKSEMKIAIVVDMWLTGFDVPSLATMYVYKPMKGHNLMQAIARVNRVFPEKEGGLIVDYVGIAGALKQAMLDYTKRDQLQFGSQDIKTSAKLKFQEKLEVCRSLLHGFDYSQFFIGPDSVRAELISGGANFFMSPQKDNIKKDYIRESQLLHNAVTLCRSLLTKEEKQEVAFMDAIRIMLSRFSQKGKISKYEINERISKLLEQSIKSEGVINLFENRDREFSLFDEGFVDEIRKMKQKNIAAQLLEKLLKERIRIYEKTNVVQSKKFSELLNSSLSNYFKGMLTNEEVIEELLKMAEEIKKQEEQGNSLGLTPEEKAFYDALTTPKGIKEAYSDSEFIALTKELTETLHKNRTIDWNRKETTRAKMRVLVKRLLKKYNYPPEGQEEALDTVMAQCNKWADNDENLE